MYCKNCGKEIESASKFCPYCGKLTEADGQEALPASQAGPVPAPEAPKGRRKGPVIALTAVLAVVVVAVAVALLSISGLFSSPKGKVTQALAKTASAYSAAVKAVDPPSLSKQTAGQAYSQDLEWALTGLDLSGMGDSTDYSFLEGLGIRASMDTDMPGRQMGLSLTPFYGAADLITVEMAVDGATVSLGSPELTGGDFYGFNTETLGQDLEALGADMGEFRSLSFNLFELADTFQTMYTHPSDSEKAMTEALQAMADAIEAEKTGTETVDINGHSMDCDIYRVVIPQAAMEDFFAAMEAVANNADHTAAMKTLYGALGLPDSVADEMLSGLARQNPYGDFYDAMETAIDAMGDLEVQLYLHGGYVMAAVYEAELEGVPVALGLYLGGGENYVDDLRLEATIDQSAFTWTSTGDHAARDGVYTDSSILRIESGGTATATVTSELRYAPKAEADNLSWRIGTADFAMDLTGQLTGETDGMALQLDDLTLSVSGSELLSMRLAYTAGAYTQRISPEAPVMLAQAGQDALTEIASELQTNAYIWLMGLITKVPALMELL